MSPDRISLWAFALLLLLVSRTVSQDASTNSLPANIRPHPPAGPAPGGPTLSVNSSYTTTANRPYDYMSGISYDQLAIVKTQWDKILQAAATASDVPLTEGARIFGKQVYYILVLWYPQSALAIGLPPVKNSTDFGGVLAGESYWNSPDADQQASRFGRCVDHLIFHLVEKDPVGYTRKEDDVAYEAYLRNQASGQSAQDILTGYLHQGVALSAAANYFLGSEYTPEIKSAFYTVFKFITWRLTIVADLYAAGYYSRYPQRFSKTPQRPLDNIPSEANYALLSQGSFNCTDSSVTCNFTVVDANGQALPLKAYERAYEDDNVVQVVIVQPSIGLPRQPRPAPGAPLLSELPTSATAGRPTDPFTGIIYAEYELANATWTAAKLVASNATGIPASMGHLSLLLQQQVFEIRMSGPGLGIEPIRKVRNDTVVSPDPMRRHEATKLTWHPEALLGFGTPRYIGIDITDLTAPFDANNPLFVHPEFVLRAAPLSQRIEDRFLELVAGDWAAFQRSIDGNAFTNYADKTRIDGASYSGLAYYMWVMEGFLSTIEFFLGSQLTDEAYSALESVNNFFWLSTFEAIHMYNIGARNRPFASEFEMVGRVPVSGTGNSG